MDDHFSKRRPGKLLSQIISYLLGKSNYLTPLSSNRFSSFSQLKERFQISKMRLLHLTILLLYISTFRVEAALIVYHRLKPNTDYIEPKDKAEKDHIRPDYSFMQSPSFKKLKLVVLMYFKKYHKLPIPGQQSKGCVRRTRFGKLCQDIYNRII